MKKSVFILICLPPIFVCQARIITVDDDGPADFNSIQAAIDDANNGDTIIVFDGTYTGDGNRNIGFDGKAITVHSENGPDFAIIDCENAGYGFHIRDNKVSEARLEGFTICNATAGAIKVFSSCPPRSADHPVAAKTDAGIFYHPGYADVLITNCVIAANPSSGILCDGHDNVTITNCKISRNGAQGIYSYMSWPTIKNCTIVENKRTGIRATGPTITNCTVAANQLYGIWLDKGTITNSIIWGNSSGQITNLRGAAVTYCDVQSRFKGQGNIDADPLFADAANGDYRLKSQAGRWDPNSQIWVTNDVTSPCIDAGDPKSPIGHEPFPNGGIINMGAYGGTSEASKSYFGETVCETIIAGDINGDCKIDFADFEIMAAHWLEDNNP